MWADLRPQLKRLKLDPTRIENSIGLGTPDVNYKEGWIELKWAERWPMRGGKLSLPHFTQEQRVWLFRRWFNGGNAFLLLKVRSDWMLFDGITAKEYVGEVGFKQLSELALVHYTGLTSGAGAAIAPWLIRKN